MELFYKKDKVKNKPNKIDHRGGKLKHLGGKPKNSTDEKTPKHINRVMETNEHPEKEEREDEEKIDNGSENPGSGNQKKKIDSLGGVARRERAGFIPFFDQARRGGILSNI